MVAEMLAIMRYLWGALRVHLKVSFSFSSSPEKRGKGEMQGRSSGLGLVVLSPDWWRALMRAGFLWCIRG